MTVGTNSDKLVDVRFGDGPRYFLAEPKDIDMRVPDQIKKCVLFVGLPEMPEPEYRGTAFIVTVPGTQSNHFAFMVTARHVAEKLEGNDFYIRANKKSGGAVDLRGRPDNPWWYHPTEKDDVDAAVTLFSPAQLAQLDIEHIPLSLFADHAVIEQNHLGVGDEIFITGLFTKLTETTKNLPIVRTGTVALIPGEKIPWDDRFIDAYLVEARSIGGLSGSPVFIRETVMMRGIPPNMVSNSPRHVLPKDMQVVVSGLGRIFFFGSIIGHWDLPKDFSTTRAEAVNMGIAPVVPASKIREIILQPELVDIMNKINEEMRKKNQSGATLDFAPSKKETLTQDEFEAALKKVSRKTGANTKT